jgi:hypothetical protein
MSFKTLICFLTVPLHKYLIAFIKAPSGFLLLGSPVKTACVTFCPDSCRVFPDQQWRRFYYNFSIEEFGGIRNSLHPV